MKIHIQIYFRFLFCIFFFFSSSENAFCNVREGDYLSRIISLFRENKQFITQESRIINQPNNGGNSANHFIFNVLDYGAKGDGIANDTEAFKITWDAACKTNGGVMLVPSGFTFLLQPVNFDGSHCQPNIVFQVDGKIVAPSDKSGWVKHDLQWLLFMGINKGITIKGKGVIDGCGLSWWNSDDESVIRPHAVTIMNSSSVTVTGIKIQNSPKMHIFIDSSQHVQIYNFTVWSPGDSPNTDGIHISRVQHVAIHNTTLACGDDCISIQTGCSDVKIYDAKCGPGHGYSIGGLGPNMQEARVSDIAVLNSAVQDSLTGVRIKTWPGAYGSVHNVVFSDITMSNVKTPIVIDQYYCGGHMICNVTDMNAVSISNITYEHIKGTYSYKPVSLACSEYIPCRNLTVAAIDIIPTAEKAKQGGTEPYCLNAYGEVLTDTTPPLEDCLLSEEALAPAMLHKSPAPAMPPKSPAPAMPPKTHGYWF